MLAEPFLEPMQILTKISMKKLLKKNIPLKITLHVYKMHRTTPTLPIVLICRSIFHENLN